MMPPPEINNANAAHPASENGRAILQPQTMLPHLVSGALKPPALATMPDAASLLKALRRRLVPALTVGLILAAIAGTTTWFLVPPAKIAARAQLYVSPAPPQILFPERNQVQNDIFQRSQAYRIRDRFVLNAAMRDPEIANLILLKEQPDPLQFLEKELKVEFPSPEIMHIVLSGDRPTDQLKIVSAVAKAYLDNVGDLEQREYFGRIRSVKDVAQRFEERFDRKRKELRSAQDQAGAINEKGMAILQQIALEELNVAKRDLTEVRQQLRRLLVDLGMKPDWVEQIWPQYAALFNFVPSISLPINHAFVALLHDESLIAMTNPINSGRHRQLEELIEKDPAVVEGMRQIEKKRVEMEMMHKALKPAAFQKQIGAKQRELASLEKAVEGERERLRPKLQAKWRSQLRVDEISDRTQRAEKYRALKSMERVLVAEVHRLDGDSKEIKKQAVDLAQLTRDLERDEKLMLSASEKLSRMEVEQEAPPRIAQPDKEAVLYTPDETKRKIMITAGAAVAALGLVLFAFSWFEFQSRKVHSADEVVHGLGLHLVGTVPDPSPKGWLPWSRNGGDSVYTQSMLTESVDAARTQLLHYARQEKLQIVMITSALSGEGKTSLASHLAASLARAGRRTILVDSDLRNPTLHRLFERTRAPGLSELLRNEADLATVSRETSIPNLWLISAGKADASALQMLAFDAIPKLFEKLRLDYDFVVVDSCPVLPVADSLLVGQHVDAVIFSLLRQVSRMPRVYAAYQRLALLGIRMLGAVVNGTDHDLYPADYNYVASESD